MLATSKVRQRERFAEAGVPQPEMRVCKDLVDAAAAANELGFPCVVKAPDRQGQRGLTLVTDARDFTAAAEQALAASRSGVCLVEELIDGQEVTVNAFSVGGRFYPLTVTDRVRAEPPAFGVALAHVWPSALDPAHVAAAIEAARNASRRARDRRRADLHAGRRRRAGAARRRAGCARRRGHDAELCEAALGVDLNELALAAALGEQIPPSALTPLQPAGGAVTQFLVAPLGAALHG